MSELLALHLENSSLCGLDAQVGKGTVRVHKGFQLHLPEHLAESGTPAEKGTWLKEELRRAGIGAKQVAVTISREECIVRRLDLPNAPDDELPDLVRMQAATVSATPLERVLLDFAPLPRLAGSEGRSVLMVTLPRERATQIRRMLEAAGLELVSLGIAPFSAAELVARAEQRRGDDPHQNALVLARYERRVEISLIRERQLIFSHSTDLIGESDEDRCKFLLPEISRVLVTLQSHLGESRIDRAWVLGAREEDELLADAVASRFTSDLEFLDPLGEPALKSAASLPPGSRAFYAAPAGALLHAAYATVPAIDLLNPRKPPVKQDNSKYRIAAIAAAVLLLLATGYAMLWLKQADLDQAIAKKEEEKLGLEQLVKKGEPMLSSAQEIESWTAKQVDWLSQLRDVHQRLPGTADVYLTDFRVTPPDTAGGVARILANGYAREQSHVEELYQRLASGPYRVRPYEYRTDGKKDPKYPFRFEINMELLPRQPQTPKQPARPAPARNLTAQAGQTRPD